MRYLTADVINFAEFKALINSVEELTDEVQIEIEKDQISWKVMDRSHIQYMEMQLNCDWFGTYKLKNTGKFLFDTEEFKKLASKIKDTAKVRLEFNENVLDIIIKDTGYTVLKLYRLDGEANCPSPPDVEHDFTMSFNLKHIVNAVKALSGIVDAMEFYFIGNHLVMGEDGSESQLYGRPWYKDNCLTKIKTHQLIPLIKAEKFSKRAEISFGNMLPLKIGIQSSRPGAKGFFLIAPYNDTDNDENKEKEEVKVEIPEMSKPGE